MENQILKAINHIKYVSKKKHCPVKIFNYLQNNGALNYDYDSVVNKIQELMENGIINQNYKIIDPVTEEISGSNDLDSQPSQISSSNITPIVNVATTPTLNTAKTPKHHSDDIETLIKSLEDKLFSKNAALQSYFFNNIFDLRKDIALLKENNEKAKPADLNNKKDEVMSLKEKIKFLESEKSFLKNDINIKQKVIDSILEHNSNLLNYQCCQGSEKANNEIYQGSSFIASNVSHLGNLRSKNPKNIIFSYININSIRNKFENLCDMVGNNVDVLSIAETKLDSSFPNAQFLLPAFQEPLRLDINNRSGGILVYIKASLPSKILSKFKLPIDIQINLEIK